MGVMNIEWIVKGLFTTSEGELKMMEDTLPDKRVYPHSDGSFVIVDIDASKGFVNLWEHLALAIFANFYLKKQLKWLFRPRSNMFNISFYDGQAFLLK